MKQKSYLTAPLLLLLLGACTVGPKYQSPETNAGKGWSVVSVEQTGPVKLEQWWRYFNDPILNELIVRARVQNLDLRQALARIEEARALRDVTNGRLYPQLDASGSITRRRQSKNGPLPVDRIPGLETKQTIFDAGFDASWELDLFGRNKRRIAAAQANLDASSAQAGDLMLIVSAEVARTYIELRGAQHALLAQRALVKATNDSLQFLATRVSLGEIPITEYTTAEIELANVETQLPLLESNVTTSALSLSILLGQLPETNLHLLEQAPELPELMEIPVGERAELLRRRADIRAAERRLAAATEETGLATAELFPKLAISAGGGFQSLSAGDLLKSASGTWLLAPVLTWRVFDGGRIKAEIRASEARTKQAALAYEDTVIEALGEAEKSLISYKLSLEALALQNKAVDAARENHRHANLRYEIGDSSKLELLDAEKRLSVASQNYVNSHTGSATALIRLFKALGGGWSEKQ